MSEKLYHKDSHIFEFEAELLECRALETGYALILDRTAFFPEGGGQAADTGYIGCCAASTPSSVCAVCKIIPASI